MTVTCWLLGADNSTVNVTSVVSEAVPSTVVTSPTDREGAPSSSMMVTIPVPSRSVLALGFVSCTLKVSDRPSSNSSPFTVKLIVCVRGDPGGKVRSPEVDS